MKGAGENTDPPTCCGGKPRRVLRLRRKRGIIIFGGGVYVDKNTSQLANVRAKPVRCSKLQNPNSSKILRFLRKPSGVQQASHAGEFLAFHELEGGAAASSEQAPYPSLPPWGESSLIPLLLLSPRDPLRWAHAGAPSTGGVAGEEITCRAGKPRRGVPCLP